MYPRPVLIVVFVLMFAFAADAHPVPFSYLDLQLHDTSIDLTLTVHIYDLAHDLQVNPMERLLDAAFLKERESAIQQILGPRLMLEADGQLISPMWQEPEIIADRQSVRFHLAYMLKKPPGMVSVSTVMFPYDENHQTFVNVYENDGLTSQLILDHNHSRTEYYAGSRQGVWAVIRKFVPAGIHHILIGPDHLLFLVGLLLMGGSARRLAAVVTSFTIAHSVTLSLAALNILTPPARFIEPAIALSIVCVGADNLLAQGGRDVRAWIAFAFGFIHGFGFANVLREMELPARALGWSLFSFNFGVEIGQLLVVITVASLFAALRSRSEWARRQLVYAGSIVVIVAGAFWFVQRVFFPGGIS
ncbi:MAG TPA: HupE/UreJ family protein [Terriglobia bacterium]|jgi:hydrogenase/urease accessory protein HupE